MRQIAGRRPETPRASERWRWLKRAQSGPQRGFNALGNPEARFALSKRSAAGVSGQRDVCQCDSPRPKYAAPHQVGSARRDCADGQRDPKSSASPGANMTRFLQQTLLAAALAAVFGVASAADEPAKKPAAAAPAAAAKDAKPPVAIDKNKISTMVGMDIGRGLAQIKDDIDIKVVEQALEQTHQRREDFADAGRSTAGAPGLHAADAGQARHRAEGCRREEQDRRHRVPGQEQGEVRRQDDGLGPAVRSREGRLGSRSRRRRTRSRSITSAPRSTAPSSTAPTIAASRRRSRSTA